MAVTLAECTKLWIYDSSTAKLFNKSVNLAAAVNFAKTNVHPKLFVLLNANSRIITKSHES